MDVSSGLVAGQVGGGEAKRMSITNCIGFIIWTITITFIW